MTACFTLKLLLDDSHTEASFPDFPRGTQDHQFQFCFENFRIGFPQFFQTWHVHSWALRLLFKAVSSSMFPNSVYGISSLRPSCLRWGTSDWSLSLPSTTQWLNLLFHLWGLLTPFLSLISSISLWLLCPSPFQMRSSSRAFPQHPLLNSIIASFTLQCNLLYLPVPIS